MNTKELKALVWTGSESEGSPVFAVIDALEDAYRGEGTVYSPREIAQAAGARLDDIDTILTSLGGEPTHALKLQWCFDDEDQGEAFIVTAAEVEEAFATGEFYHPETGDEVPDFRKHIYKCFLSDRFAPRVKAEAPTASSTDQAARKVYIVFDDHYDSHDIVGIYASKADADRAVQTSYDKTRGQSQDSTFYVEERDVL